MSDRSLSLSCLLVALAVVGGHAVSLGDWMLDDAFIFFRYAENWALGNGILFNVGEEPVEGFTSFLWLALLTGVHACGVDLVHAATGLGVAAVVGTLVLVNQSWRFVPGISVREAAFATVLLGTTGAFTTWARAGMETGLHALLVVAAVLAYLGARERSAGFARFVGIGLVFALLGANRPDGLLVVGVLALDALLRVRTLGWSRVLTTAGVFLVVFGAYFAWRYSYFGYPFPNTFYAKVGSSGSQLTRGLDYAGTAALTLGPILVLALVSVRRWLRTYGVVAVLVVAYTAYIVSVGGDVMPAHRFFTPIVPLLCLLAGMALPAFVQPFGWAAAGVAAAFGIVIMATTLATTIRSDVVAYNGRISGEWLKEHAPEGAVVATNTAGSVVYYSGLRAIDMLGLNDVHIAHAEVDMGAGFAGHEKGDGAYVFRRRPEFVQMGSSLGWAPTKINPVPPFLGDRQLFYHPEFAKTYKLYYTQGETVWPGGTKCGVFGFYVRNDVFERLPKMK